MTKPFLSLDGQMTLLQSRSMDITDDSKAKYYLHANNYYNVINMYAKFFRKNDGTDDFLPGTNFDEVIAIHYFEKEFRSHLIKYILIIEGNLRSIVSHTFSEYHRESYDYLNSSNFDQSDIFNVTLTLSKIVSFIQYAQRQKNNSINHYEKKHGCIPLWVLVSLFDFGTIENFYKNMKIAEKNIIAKYYSDRLKEFLETDLTITPAQLSSFLANIRELRNVLAHDNKLIGFKCKRNIIYFPTLHDIVGISANSPKQDVYNVFVIMRALLSKDDYANLYNTILKRVNRLNRNLNTITINDVISSYGFPEDWHLSSKLPQT